MEPTFGNAAFTDVYSYWSDLDLFERGSVLITLDPAGTCTREITSDDLSNVSTSDEPFKIVHRHRSRKRPIQMLSESEFTRSSENVLATSSKNKLYIMNNCFYV